MLILGHIIYRRYNGFERAEEEGDFLSAMFVIHMTTCEFLTFIFIFFPSSTYEERRTQVIPCFSPFFMSTTHITR